MDLYYMPESPACQSVLMTAATLGLKLNKKLLDLIEGDHLQPDFLKLNPQHMIPTLVDNGFSIWESRAILIYLVEKYGITDALYPNTPEQHAIINQRLYFDMGTLYQAFRNYYYPLYTYQEQVDPKLFKEIENAFELLNKFLEDRDYVAGDDLTIADISILATVSAYDIVDFHIRNYRNVEKWYENCKKVVPGWEENWEGCLKLKEFFENKMKRYMTSCH